MKLSGSSVCTFGAWSIVGYIENEISPAIFFLCPLPHIIITITINRQTIAIKRSRPYPSL